MNYGMFSGLNGATFSALMRLSNNVVLNAGVCAGFAQGQTSASGTNRLLKVGQRMSALPEYFRHQLVPLAAGCDISPAIWRIARSRRPAARFS
jgi:hypothetical protein